MRGTKNKNGETTIIMSEAEKVFLSDAINEIVAMSLRGNGTSDSVLPLIEIGEILDNLKDKDSYTSLLD